MKRKPFFKRLAKGLKDSIKTMKLNPELLNKEQYNLVKEINLATRHFDKYNERTILRMKLGKYNKDLHFTSHSGKLIFSDVTKHVASVFNFLNMLVDNSNGKMSIYLLDNDTIKLEANDIMKELYITTNSILIEQDRDDYPVGVAGDSIFNVDWKTMITSFNKATKIEK